MVCKFTLILFGRHNMARAHLKLHGQYKVDVFDVSGNLLRTSDYIDNFITNSGTLYPYYFAFADCFRYLSLGTGTGRNSTGLSMAATTGLNSGVDGFQYIDSGFYTTGGFLGGGCGNFVDPSSNTITLIRQWGLPDITGGFFNSTVNFSEIMVSPGRPYVTGFTDNTHSTPTGLCSCSEQGYSISNFGVSPDLTGLDCSQIAVYYSLLPNLQETVNNQDGSQGGLRKRLKLCDAPFAFSRITGNFHVNSGEVFAVTYRLNLIFDTGIQSNKFYSSIPTGTDLNFNALGFASNITNPRVKLIVDSYLSQNNSTIYAPNSNLRMQQIDFINNVTWPVSSLYGESFVPSLGIPLEPSCIYGDGGNFAVYVSDDNTQFLVSPTGGICPTGLYRPWNTTGKILPQNSGLMTFQTVLSGNVASGAVWNGGDSEYWFRNPYNIRTTSSSVGYPDSGDVSSLGSQTPNIYAGKQSRSYFQSGHRGGSITTNYQFPDYAINVGIGAVQYVKSFVVGFIDSALMYSTYGNAYQNDITNVMPFFDCLFSGLSGSGIFLPIIETGTNDNLTTTKILDSDNTTYNYLTGQNGSIFPTFNNQLSWTADCPSGVDGC